MGRKRKLRIEMKHIADFPDYPLDVRRNARDVYLRQRTVAKDVCGYCGAPVVWLELLPPGVRILKKTPTEVVWRNRGRTFTMMPATVEHIRPLSKGGGNFIENLMAACQPCNHEQGSGHAKVSSELRPFRHRSKAKLTLKRKNTKSPIPD